MISCSDAANYFIWLANDTGSFISNLKLQKLVYYAQAWHLALHDEPLLEEDFQAWIHGPVIPELFREYKPFGWKPIQKELEEDSVKRVFSEDALHFLEEVSDVYFPLDGYELERMTHAEDPWIQAKNRCPVDVSPCEIISKESMKEYYKSRLEEN